MNIKTLYYLFSILGAVMVFMAPSSYAQTELGTPSFRATNLPLPRFVSLSADEVNVRTGPALRYPIRWVFKKNGLPVEIVQEFDHWRKIRDRDGDEGWVHKSLLSSKRGVIVVADGLVDMRSRKMGEGRMVARLEPGLIIRVDECEKYWCRLEKDGYRGWVERKFVWGIYEHEFLN